MFTKRFFIVSAVLILVVLATTSFSIANAPKSAVIPVTGVQAAWGSYLAGERSSISLPKNAFQAYLAGERISQGRPSLNADLSAYHAGERLNLSQPAASAALAAYHAGERSTIGMTNGAAAFQTYGAGERSLASSPANAWQLYRQGERGQ